MNDWLAGPAPRCTPVHRALRIASTATAALFALLLAAAAFAGRTRGESAHRSDAAPVAANTPAKAARVAAPAPAHREPIVLLDLNYTFVENQAEAAKLGGEDFGDRLRYERYRTWLRDFVRQGHVVLITARPERYRAATLARIDSLLGWHPDEAWFNEHDLNPAVCKQEILLKHIFPRYGRPSDGTRYVAVESNPRTAFMYAGYGIPAMRVWDDWQYVDSTRAAK